MKPKSRATQRETPKIAIIGAGMAGIAAAKTLSVIGEVTIFEKSRGIGGRMATRYAGEYEFDHGAQYFTIKDKRFEEALADITAAGDVLPWLPRMLEARNTQPDKRIKWVGAPRMNTLGKALAQGLKVKTGHKIIEIMQTWGGWRLITDEDKTQQFFDWVVFAIPSHQSSAIIPDIISFKPELDRLPMRAAFTVMLGIPAVWTTRWQAASFESGPISWVTINSAKPGRSKGVTSIVIQSDNDWAQARIDDDREAIKAELINEASKRCGIDVGRANHSAIHRWLYANPAQISNRQYLIDAPAKIAACGDWAIAGRVESAYLSGLECARAIMGSIDAAKA